jgi:hypothetical protein
VIQRSLNTISAPPSQVLGTRSYTFGTWSDGGAPTHDLIAPAKAKTFTAKYRRG